MQWAAHMVNEAKDRSKTLIKRVMHLSDTNDSFEVITNGPKRGLKLVKMLHSTMLMCYKV